MSTHSFLQHNTVKDLTATGDLSTEQVDDKLTVSLIGGPATPVPLPNSSDDALVRGRDQPESVGLNQQAGSHVERPMYPLAEPSSVSHGSPCNFSQSLQASADEPSEIVNNPLSSQNKGPEKEIEDESRRCKTLTDLALYYAGNWNARQEVPAETADQLFCDYVQKLDLLSRVLPSRLQQNLFEVTEKLSMLFESSYPMVLDHASRSDLSIFVDPSTGSISSIAEWEGASICPFGISLWGLEHFLGTMGSDGWRYHSNHQQLRKQFWRSFEDAVGGLSEKEREAIETARMAGLYFRYGYESDNESMELVQEGTSAFTHLDVFCASQG